MRLILTAFAVFISISTTVYLPLLTSPSEFVADDHTYITLNPAVSGPMTIHSVVSLLTDSVNHEYTPLTMLTFRLDASLWGTANAAGFRMTNIILFSFLGAVLCFLYLRLRKTALASDEWLQMLMVAGPVLLIMLHPVNVESIASVSSRKELLYALFGLSALTVYVSESLDLRKLALCLCLLLCAQFSKGTAFIVPVLFLSYEVLFRRLYEKQAIRTVPLCISFAAVLPVFAWQFSVALQGVTDPSGVSASPEARIGGIARTFNTALVNILFPYRLSHDYDIRWPQGLNIGLEWLLPCLVFLGIAWTTAQRRYRLLFLVTLFLLPLAPYLNVLPIRHYRGFMAHYDHYLLVPVAGLSLLAAWTMSLAGPTPKKWVLIVTAAGCIMLGAYDHHISQMWKTEISLYANSIQTAPALPRPYYFLGNAYIKAGRYEEAASVLTEGLKLDPGDLNMLQSLGDALAFSGRHEKAEVVYHRYLEHRPDDLKAIQNLSNTLVLSGKYDEAMTMISRWLKLNPADPAAYGTLRFLEEHKTAKPAAEKSGPQ